MGTFNRWLREPLSTASAVKLWVTCAAIVFGIWFVVPIVLAGSFPAQFLAIPLSLRNLAIAASTSFGEELVFRAFPVMAVLYFFPRQAILALLVGLGAAYPFGIWHNWGTTTQACLSIGSAALVLVYLKFGGASGKPFQGFLAGGGIHLLCNVTIAIIANIVVAQ